MELVVETSPRRPSLEVAVSHALVERVNEKGLGSVLRLYRPAPTVAFGRLDALRPGYRGGGRGGARARVRAGAARAGRPCRRLPRGLPRDRRGARGGGSDRRHARPLRVVRGAAGGRAADAGGRQPRRPRAGRVLPRRLHGQRARRGEAGRDRPAGRAPCVAARRLRGGSRREVDPRGAARRLRGARAAPGTRVPPGASQTRCRSPSTTSSARCSTPTASRRRPARSTRRRSSARGRSSRVTWFAARSGGG